MSTSTEAKPSEGRGFKIGYYIDKSGCMRCPNKKGPLQMVKYNGEKIWACELCLEEIEDEQKPIKK